MSKKTNGVRHGMTVGQRDRRRRVLSKLKQQLESGMKTKKKTTDVLIPLTEKDTKRIKREIETLKERV